MSVNCVLITSEGRFMVANLKHHDQSFDSYITNIHHLPPHGVLGLSASTYLSQQFLTFFSKAMTKDTPLSHRWINEEIILPFYHQYLKDDEISTLDFDAFFLTETEIFHVTDTLSILEVTQFAACGEYEMTLFPHLKKLPQMDTLPFIDFIQKRFNRTIRGLSENYVVYELKQNCYYLNWRGDTHVHRR